jgi:hypothetical protein
MLMAISNNWCCPSSSHILALWLWPTLTYTRKHTFLKVPCYSGETQARPLKLDPCPGTSAYVPLVEVAAIAAFHSAIGQGRFGMLLRAKYTYAYTNIHTW